MDCNISRLNFHQHQPLLPLLLLPISRVSTTASSSTATSSTTPIQNQIQQQIQQYDLFTQCKILNKQLGLLRANPSNNATSLSLENVINFINAVEIVLPSTSNEGCSIRVRS